MACRPCHMSKVKCSKTNPCIRCERLQLDCVPHLSRQGQRRKRTDSAVRFNDGTEQPQHRQKLELTRELETSKDKCAFPEEDASENIVETAVITSSSKLGPSHFGLHLLLRQWISFAVTRRSFSLLAKASILATRVGVPMDRIICGAEWPKEWSQNISRQSPYGSRMEYLPDIILKTREQQNTVSGRRMQFSELPKPLLVATSCVHNQSDENCNEINKYASKCHHDSPPHLGSRFIFIKAMDCGVARFFTSTAFEHDVCSWKSMVKQWKQNKEPVIHLFLPQSETSKYGHGLANQISLHAFPNIDPVPIKLPTTQIKLKTGAIVKAECVQCLHIAHIDLSFMYTEYIPIYTRDAETSISSFSNENWDPFELDKIAGMDWTSELDEWVQEMTALEECGLVIGA